MAYRLTDRGFSVVVLVPRQHPRVLALERHLTGIVKCAYNGHSPTGLARNRRLVMATMEDLDYSPCEECGDGMSETLNQSGKVLCEKCHNKINCGCETCNCEEAN
jgi:hypothetical protein